jgi:hypothetical protein
MVALRSRLAVALAAIGVAFAAFVGGEHGAARAAIGNATGPLIGSPLAGAAILAADGMAPGDVKVGYIEVSNIGDISGSFALGSTGLNDTPLSRALDLTVEDVTPGQGATLVYSGKLASLSSVGLGDMAQGAMHRYRFSVSLPSDADDRYQGASSAVTFMWSATAPDVVSTSTPTPTPSATPGATKAAPATTAESPGKATTAGTTVKPGATLSARARQKGTAGKVSATVTCRSDCRIALGGTATAGPVKVKLKTVKRKLAKAKRVTIRMTLPARARLALAGGRAVTVRLSLKATVGTRVVTVRRTVRIASASR